MALNLILYLSIIKMKQENLTFAFSIYDEFAEILEKCFKVGQDKLKVWIDFCIFSATQLAHIFILACIYIGFTDYFQKTLEENKMQV